MKLNGTDSERDKIAQDFRSLLNRHGFGFQYSSLKESDLSSKRPFFRWIAEATEFPVQIGNKCTKIDFVLKSRNSPIYLLVECKRANPAVKNWCFAKSPYVRRDCSCEDLVVEHTQLFPKSDQVASNGAILQQGIDNDAYHIALEVKSNEKGDCDGKGSGAIEEAASQVCLGLNGMVELFTKKPALFAKQSQAVFLPIIFTTARIFVTNAELHKSPRRMKVASNRPHDLRRQPDVFNELKK